MVSSESIDTEVEGSMPKLRIFSGLAMASFLHGEVVAWTSTSVVRVPEKGCTLLSFTSTPTGNAYQ